MKIKVLRSILSLPVHSLIFNLINIFNLLLLAPAFSSLRFRVIGISFMMSINILAILLFITINPEPIIPLMIVLLPFFIIYKYALDRNFQDLKKLWSKVFPHDVSFDPLRPILYATNFIGLSLIAGLLAKLGRHETPMAEQIRSINESIFGIFPTYIKNLFRGGSTTNDIIIDNPLLLSCCIFMLPFWMIFYFRFARLLRSSIIFLIAVIIFVALVAFILIPIMDYIFYLMPKIIIYLISLLTVVFTIVCTVSVSGVGLICGLHLKDRFLDYRKMQTHRAQFDGSRLSIARSLHEIHSSAGRMSYLKWVDAQNSRKEIFEMLKNSSNRWPDNKRPNWAGDSVSQYLAMIDEKWLGLQQRT